MMKKLAVSAVAALLIGSGAWAGEGGHVKDEAFSFEGPFGTFNQAQLQRGLQVYTEVCSACHGLKFVTFRELGEPGGPSLSKSQVKTYAAAIDITDPATGDTHPGKPTDYFPKSQLSNAPDLSVMAQARAGFKGPHGLLINQLLKGIGGPEYIVALLNGFTGKEKDVADTTFYQNPIFSTGWIAMPPPLSDGQVEFADGSPNDVHSMAMDVAAFLKWTAEPKMMVRKQSGLISVLLLALLAALLYLTNKRLWAPIKGKHKGEDGKSKSA